ncbi:hypothetical protein [Longispora urticae]
MFAGEWLAYAASDGSTRYRAGYAGTRIDASGKFPEFQASHLVAEAIVTEKCRLRAALRGDLEARSPPRAVIEAAVDAGYSRVYFYGTQLINVRHTPGASEFVAFSSEPDQRGEYEVGWSWPWMAVHPDLCDQVIGAL